MNLDQDSAGQDAFLDIVANLVGILIILVVLVGAQAATVWKHDDSAAAGVAEQLQFLTEETLARSNESKSLQFENAELRQKQAEEQSISEQLTEIRRQLLFGLETARRGIEAKKSALGVQHRESVNASTEIETLKQKIRQVQFESQAVEQQQAAIIETIEHYPTPIAKTVFSDEIHFRILGGRVVYVPLDELVEAMKNQWQLSAGDRRNAENTWETVGPIGEFRLQFMVSVVEDRGQQMVQLQRFVLQPAGQNIGEAVDQALQEGSQFRQRMARMKPGKTTVSFWVYPDGYGHLDTIRVWLRGAGFQTASWPLEYDGLISGGPQGFRTTTN